MQSSHNQRPRWLSGLAAASIVALISRRARALSASGLLAAIPVGTAVFSGTGAAGSVPFMSYFLSSSILGRLPKNSALEQRRGNERDAVQVLANGAVPALLAAASERAGPDAQEVLLAGFGGAIAAATADTWATEIGSRLGGQPRSIIGLRPVPPGASGGITLVGLAASAVGALLIATVASARPMGNGRVRANLAAMAIGGFAGSLIDSVLGATVQEVRYCDVCRRESEHQLHQCGNRTRVVRGVARCDNDVVNALAVALGATVSMAPIVSAARKREAIRALVARNAARPDARPG